MSPTIATTLGFVVAGLIMLWAVVILVQRLNRHRSASKRSLWVTWKPTSVVKSEDISRNIVPEPSTDDTDRHDRAKQNGHYSHPK